MSEDQPTVITSKSGIPKILIALIGVILLIGVGFVIFKGSKPQVPSITQTTPTPTPSKISINCPTIAEFCQKAKPIINNGNIIAISSNVPVNTPIRAVFDGKTIGRSVNAEGAPRETFYSVSLINEQELKAVYYFKNKVSVKESLRSGEVLASASAEPIKFFSNNNFAFSLLDKDNQIIPIEKIEFR